MSNSSHYENANFLRELAKNLPRILSAGNADKATLLQHLANEKLLQTEYEEKIYTKVITARADSRPGMTSEQLRQHLHDRCQERYKGV